LGADEVCFFSLFPYKGTEAYQELKELEKEGKVKFLYDYEDYLYKSSPNIDWPVYESPEFTKKQRIELLRKGRSLQVRTIFTSRYGKFLGMIFYALFRSDHSYHLANRIRLTAWGAKINKRINRVFR
jgi:hypothetical protein